MYLSDRFIKAGDDLCDFDHHVPAPYLRRRFSVDRIPERCEVTICGLGFYRLWINGVEITRGPLSPGITNPDDVCFYDHYEIGNHLIPGENVIGVILGNGFRNPFGGFIWDFEKAACRGPVCLALAVEADGMLLWEADENFRTHPSHITFDDLRMGCRCDARLEIAGWNTLDFDDSGWKRALPCEAPKGERMLQTAPPIKTLRIIEPVSVTHYDRLPFVYESAAYDAKPLEQYVRENVYVFDFGVNTAGVTRLHIHGEPGQKIVIRHGEHNNKMGFSVNTTLFFRDYSLSKYADFGQTDVYICRGGDEVFVPDFKYDGFRYAYVEGLRPEQLREDTLLLLEQSSLGDTRADFACSDPILNKLQEFTLRSDRANFFWLPTDCPHREKNGWTGDASTSAEQFLVNFPMAEQLKQWMISVRKAQKPDGDLPGIVPTGGWGFAWGNGPAWDAVCVNVPYYIYRFDGDPTVVTENRNMILRYFRYAGSRLDSRGLADFGLGDWMDPLQNTDGVIRAPLVVTSSAELYDIAVKAAAMFAGVGDVDAAGEASAFADRMKKAIRANLIDFETMTVSGDCQASQAVGMGMGIFEPEEVERAGERLVEIIHRDGDVSACGMIGMRYLFHVLCGMGQVDLAYRMITNTEDRGCYGYWVSHGATSLWESFDPWDSDVCSRNHHFFGDISSFLIQDVAGLRPNPRLAGTNTVEIVPHFPAGLEYARASWEETTVSWQREGNTIVLDITIPAGKRGKLLLEDGYRLDGVTETQLMPGIHRFCMQR